MVWDYLWLMIWVFGDTLEYNQDNVTPFLLIAETVELDECLTNLNIKL